MRKVPIAQRRFHVWRCALTVPTSKNPTIPVKVAQHCAPVQLLTSAALVDCDDQFCLTCDITPTNCTGCFEGGYLSGNECTATCPDGQFEQDLDNTCRRELRSLCPSPFVLTVSVACASSCKTCELTASRCTSCESPAFLFEAQCLLQCPNGLFTSPVTDSCEESCPDGTYPETNGNVCEGNAPSPSLDTSPLYL